MCAMRTTQTTTKRGTEKMHANFFGINLSMMREWLDGKNLSNIHKIYHNERVFGKLKCW